MIGFTAPRIVGEFIRGLPKSRGGKKFSFRTAGGYDIREILERSGTAKEASKKPAFFDNYVADDTM